MKDFAFWGFFGFGALSVLLAFGGGFFALTRRGGAATGTLGFLLIFLGTSLALMLGSLLFIRKKEKRGAGDRKQQGGKR